MRVAKESILVAASLMIQSWAYLVDLNTEMSLPYRSHRIHVLQPGEQVTVHLIEHPATGLKWHQSSDQSEGVINLVDERKIESKDDETFERIIDHFMTFEAGVEGQFELDFAEARCDELGEKWWEYLSWPRIRFIVEADVEEISTEGTLDVLKGHHARVNVEEDPERGAWLTSLFWYGGEPLEIVNDVNIQKSLLPVVPYTRQFTVQANSAGTHQMELVQIDELLGYVTKVTKVVFKVRESQDKV